MRPAGDQAASLNRKMFMYEPDGQVYGLEQSVESLTDRKTQKVLIYDSWYHNGSAR